MKNQHIFIIFILSLVLTTIIFTNSIYFSTKVNNNFVSINYEESKEGIGLNKIYRIRFYNFDEISRYEFDEASKEQYDEIFGAGKYYFAVNEMVSKILADPNSEYPSQTFNINSNESYLYSDILTIHYGEDVFRLKKNLRNDLLSNYVFVNANNLNDRVINTDNLCVYLDETNFKNVLDFVVANRHNINSYDLLENASISEADPFNLAFMAKQYLVFTVPIFLIVSIFFSKVLFDYYEKNSLTLRRYGYSRKKAFKTQLFISFISVLASTCLLISLYFISNSLYYTGFWGVYFDATIYFSSSLVLLLIFVLFTNLFYQHYSSDKKVIEGIRSDDWS